MANFIQVIDAEAHAPCIIDVDRIVCIRRQQNAGLEILLDGQHDPLTIGDATGKRALERLLPRLPGDLGATPNFVASFFS
jgi:hypothetical protein